MNLKTTYLYLFPFFLFFGYINFYLYYKYFNINITEFIELDEILLLMFTDIQFIVFTFFGALFFSLTYSKKELKIREERKKELMNHSNSIIKYITLYFTRPYILTIIITIFLWITILHYFTNIEYGYLMFFGYFLILLEPLVEVLIIFFDNKYFEITNERFNLKVKFIITMIVLFFFISGIRFVYKVNNVLDQHKLQISFVYNGKLIKNDNYTKYIGSTKDNIFFYSLVNSQTQVFYKVNLKDLTFY